MSSTCKCKLVDGGWDAMHTNANPATLFSIILVPNWGFYISVYVKMAIKNEATNFLLFAGGCSAVSSSYSFVVVTDFGFHNRGGQLFMILLNLSLFHSLLH